MKLSPTSKPDFVQLDYSECVININLRKDYYASKHVLKKTMQISILVNGIQLHPQQKIDSCSRSVYIPYYPSKKRSCWIASHEMLVKIRTSGSSFFSRIPNLRLKKGEVQEFIAYCHTIWVPTKYLCASSFSSWLNTFCTQDTPNVTLHL